MPMDREAQWRADHPRAVFVARREGAQLWADPTCWYEFGPRGLAGTYVVTPRDWGYTVHAAWGRLAERSYPFGQPIPEEP